MPMLSHLNSKSALSSHLKLEIDVHDDVEFYRQPGISSFPSQNEIGPKSRCQFSSAAQAEDGSVHGITLIERK